MEASLKKMEDNLAHLEVVVPVEKVEEALDRASRKLARSVNIPGFRKGKAPRGLVERHLGKDRLRQEALEMLVPEAYARAVEDTEIEPIDQPELSDIEWDEGKPLTFRAKVEVKPEVGLGDYRSIRLERREKEVTREDVQNVLDRLREQNAQLVAVEEGARAERGHFAVVDFRGVLEGESEPFAGGSAQNYLLEIGSGALIEEFESGLVGMRPGENKEIRVTFPEDFNDPKLAGKTARFSVTLKELKEKELPAQDDAFARTVGEFENLDALEKEIERQLRQQAAEEADRRLRREALDKVVEQAAVDPPEVLVERRLDQLVEEFRRRIEAQSLRLEDYLSHRDQTMEDLRNEFRPRAVENVKADLVLEAIARKEELEPEEKDFAEEAARVAEAEGRSVEQVRRLMKNPEIRAEIAAILRKRKSLDFLVAVATGS